MGLNVDQCALRRHDLLLPNMNARPHVRKLEDETTEESRDMARGDGGVFGTGVLLVGDTGWKMVFVRELQYFAKKLVG